MNGAPDWQDGELCFRCRTQFTLVARKHHCRNCGNIFCAKCSSQQIPLPKLNIEKNVRVCDTCYEKIASKNEDPLTLALGSKDKEQAKPKASNSNSKSSSSNNVKPAASASAPSEQELKEEEEFQLALALSLSETPTKVSFPDCRHFEENDKATSKTPTLKSSADNNNGNRLPPASTQNGTAISNYLQSDTVMKFPVNSIDKSLSNNSYPSVQQQPAQQQQVLQAQPQQTIASQGAAIDYQIQDRDREVFRFVGEVQSTLEVFTNRLESCKLRNRPISNEAAIQAQFLRLNTEIQPKLAEYIQSYDEERADFERLQDKLSQIADARAALDALREEHQEKMRQQAAEADRLRQTQLATKLEAMRQKKSQMMQYQRELALQRIREQEMAMQQAQQPPPANQSYQVPPVPGHQVVDPTQLGHQMHTTSNQPLEQLAMHQDWTQPGPQHNVPDSRYTSVPHTSYTPAQQIYQSQQIAVQPPSTTQMPHVSQQQGYAAPAVPAPQQQQPVIDRASIAQLERQFLPDTKPEEDAPLISFDD